jgi:hypothetical protein
MCKPFLLLIGLALVLPAARAASFTILQPSADRWMYPFATSGGTQAQIQVFGATGNADFDDRDGQMFLRFDTTGIVSAGLGAANYQLSTLTLTLTLATAGTIYDPASETHRIELFGVGYRNGVTAATWGENSVFGNGATMGKGVRSAYAAGFNAGGNFIDVSNSVTDGFTATPWAVGMVAGAAAGVTLSADVEMSFTLNLSDAAILAYAQAALNRGYIDLMVTSLYPASQPGTGAQSNFPVFYSKESPYQDITSGNPADLVAGRLSGSLVVVPEPGTCALLGFGIVLGLVARLRRNRHA